MHLDSSSLQASHTLDTMSGDGKPPAAWLAVKPYLNGGLSGMAATCIIQPIDMVKVRIQLGAKGSPVSACFVMFLDLPVFCFVTVAWRLLQHVGVLHDACAAKSPYQIINCSLLCMHHHQDTCMHAT